LAKKFVKVIKGPVEAQLIEDAKVFLGGQSTPLDQAAAQANKKWMYGYGVDNTLSADVDTLLAEGRDFLEQSEEDLRRQIAFASLIHS
jgi:hypothetical protein